MKPLQRWKQTALHNKALVATSVLVAIGTLFYAGAAAFQVWLMNESMNESAIQQQRLVDSTNDAIAKAIAESNRSLRDALAKNKEAFGADLAQAKTALDVSIKQAKATSRLDQRAWIAINSGNAPKIAAGTKIGFQLQMTNSGHTFALNVIQRAGYRTLPKKQPLDFGDQLRKIPAFSQGAIGPGGSRIIDQTIETPLSADDATSLMTGAEIFYVFGKITYLDIFHQEHWTKFCMMLDIHPNTQNGFTACESAGNGYTYNDAD